MGIFCSRVGKLDVKLGKSGNGRDKKNVKKQVIIMKFSIVEIVPTSDDDIFKLSPASQLPYGAEKDDIVLFFC